MQVLSKELKNYVGHLMRKQASSISNNNRISLKREKPQNQTLDQAVHQKREIKNKLKNSVQQLGVQYLKIRKEGSQTSDLLKDHL
jgi:hypothetical protein